MTNEQKEQHEYFDDALRLLEIHDMQRTRVLRKAIAYFRTPDGQSKRDLEYEVGLLKGLCGGKRDGTIPKDDEFRTEAPPPTQ